MPRPLARAVSMENSDQWQRIDFRLASAFRKTIRSLDRKRTGVTRSLSIIDREWTRAALRRPLHAMTALLGAFLFRAGRGCPVRAGCLAGSHYEGVAHHRRDETNGVGIWRRSQELRLNRRTTRSGRFAPFRAQWIDNLHACPIGGILVHADQTNQA
jgi:hypothetical protein